MFTEHTDVDWYACEHGPFFETSRSMGFYVVGRYGNGVRKNVLKLFPNSVFPISISSEIFSLKTLIFLIAKATHSIVFTDIRQA